MGDERRLMSEIVTKTKGNRAAIALIAVAILALAGGGLAWWIQAHPNFDRYSAALEALKAHRVSVDGAGRVNFSRDFPGLVPQDKAYATWLDDGNFRALFPTHLWEGTSLSGLMYTSRPLTEDDIETRLSGINFQQRVIPVGSYQALLLDKKLNDHWYEVSFHVR